MRTDSVGLRALACKTMLALLTLTLPSTAFSAQQWTHYSNFSEISALADDGRYLWAGTRGGLIRMDKNSSEKSYFNQAPFIPSLTPIVALDCDTSGHLAALTSRGGLVEFDGKTWSNLGASAALVAYHPLDLGYHASGTLYVLVASSDSGKPSVFRRRDGQWLHIPLEGVLATQGYLMQSGFFGAYGSIQPHIQVDDQDHAWVSTGNTFKQQLYRITTEGKADSVSIPEPIHSGLFVQPKQGHPYWLISGMLLKPSSNGWDTVPLPFLDPPLKAHPRNLFARSPEGLEYWAFGRLRAYHNGVWSIDSLPGDSVTHLPLLLAQPNRANSSATGSPLLYAARGDRLATFKNQEWQIQDISKKPLGVGHFSVALPRGKGDAEILLTNNRTLQVFDPRHEKSTPLPFLHGSSEIGYPANAIGEAPDGRVWALSRFGLYRLEANGMERLVPTDSFWTTSDAFKPGTNGFLIDDDSGNIWASAKGRLISIPRHSGDTRSWKSHWLPQPFGPHTEISALTAHPDGSLWFYAQTSAKSGSGHLARYDGNAWKFFDANHHAWMGALVPPLLACDGRGHVWAKYSRGLLQWDGQAWKEHAFASSPYFPNGINALAVDKEGMLWAAAAGPQGRLLRYKGEWEIMAETHTRLTAYTIQSMTFDGSGKLWILSLDANLLVFDPGLDSTGERPTTIRKSVSIKAKSNRALRHYDLRGRETSPLYRFSSHLSSHLLPRLSPSHLPIKR